ncbi:MAG: segregation/condensation protein A [Clostridia bacterium]|nr:segregation/condensation protein A [Clostridia bacterium]
MNETRFYTAADVAGYEISDPDAPSFRLESFEGPLDLLLYLISKHKLDIYDIPIVELVDQYLEFVRLASDRDMDLASDFLAMAARLVQIKSAALLPVYDDTAEKLKKELTGELIDYRDCKRAAELLDKQSYGMDYSVREQAEDIPLAPYSRVYPLEKLLKAYRAAAGRRKDRLQPNAEAFRQLVAKRFVSVSSRFFTVIDYLVKKKRGVLKAVFARCEDRSELVATFLAVLELAKNKNIRIEGEQGMETLTLIDTELRGLKYEE